MTVVTGLGLLVIAAVTVLLWPTPSTQLLAWTLGTSLVLVGVLDLVVAVGLPRSSNLLFAATAGGLSHVGLGLAKLLWPSISAFSLGVVLGLWLLLLGIRVIVQASDRVRAGDTPEVVATGRWSPAARILGSLAMLIISALAMATPLIIE